MNPPRTFDSDLLKGDEEERERRGVNFLPSISSLCPVHLVIHSGVGLGHLVRAGGHLRHGCDRRVCVCLCLCLCLCVVLVCDVV